MKIGRVFLPCRRGFGIEPVAERLLGWRPDDLICHKLLDVVYPADQAVVKNAISALQSGARETSKLFRHRRPDGDWLWLDARSRLNAAGANGQPAGHVVVLRDATQTKEDESTLKEALEHVERLAATDDLTGLANRRRLREVAEREWRRCPANARRR